MNKTGIEWTDFSSNPLYVVDRETGKRGWFCEKVSPGCANCYASALNVRRGTGHAYVPANRDKVEWRLNERELEAILRRRKPARIFMCDMTDLFHEDVPFRWIGQIWRVMLATSQHTFQVLTKRPDRMRDFIRWMEASHHDHLEGAIGAGTWPLPNVWLGVSVENQRMADERIPVLLDTPAAVRFLSCEPLLGPLDLISACEGTRNFLEGIDFELLEPWPDNPPRISWVIVGGESGPGSAERKLVERCTAARWLSAGKTKCCGRDKSRFGHDDARCEWCLGAGWRPKPQALEWVRSLRDQCVAAGTAFHFKQFGGLTPKTGGRLLDGRAWSEMPGCLRRA